MKIIEIFIIITNFLIFGLIIITPILLLVIINKYKIRRASLFYAILGLFLLGLLVVFFAWWSHATDLFLLKQYGYNLDGMNETKFYGNVLSEKIEQVKKLETSIMGLGWPLKAIFGFVTIIPYLIIVYLGKILFEQKKNVA